MPERIREAGHTEQHDWHRRWRERHVSGHTCLLLSFA
jgi:hypothetical protein